VEKIVAGPGGQGQGQGKRNSVCKSKNDPNPPSVGASTAFGSGAVGAIVGDPESETEQRRVQLHKRTYNTGDASLDAGEA